MLSVSPQHRVFLAVEPIDFRKGLDAIVRLCQHQFFQSPNSGSYFIFRNKRKTDLKLLYYDSQGYCLFQKRLSTGRFLYWPNANTPMVTLTSTQIQVLLFNGDPMATAESPPFYR